MEVPLKRCVYCDRRFQPDPRTAKYQKTCPRQGCRRERERQKLRHWRKLHPDRAVKWAPKVRAWAKSYPVYWQQWRADPDHRDYRERERRRMRAKRRKACRVANETGMAKVAVEKLRGIQAERPETVANETTMSRRLDAVVEFLLWKEAVAKPSGMESAMRTER